MDAKIQGFRLGILRRPGRVLLPDIGAGFEGMNFGKLRLRSAFQIPFEEWEKNALPKIIIGDLAKIHPAEMRAIPPLPTAMRPWTDHQHIRNLRIVLGDRPVGRERTFEVLGIEPAAHG